MERNNGHRITELIGLRPKMYCPVVKKNVVHNAVMVVFCNVVIDSERMNVKNIELYKRILKADSK